MAKKPVRTPKKKVSYLYDNLSGVTTKALKCAMRAYKMLLASNKHRGCHDTALDAIHRIEGELLGRKELPFK
ncbi:MAG: hypothetical protein AAB477_02810 [Patescibacteria group bacterium]